MWGLVLLTILMLLARIDMVSFMETMDAALVGDRNDSFLFCPVSTNLNNGKVS
jgi:hypothetical protein